MDFTEYESEEMMRLAVERLLEIVEESLAAALRINPELATQFPDLRRAVGLPNRIIHGYGDINHVVIWDVVKINLPALTDQLESILKNAEQEE